MLGGFKFIGAWWYVFSHAPIICGYPLRTFGTQGTVIVPGKWQASIVVVDWSSLTGGSYPCCILLLRLQVGFTGGVVGRGFFFFYYQRQRLGATCAWSVFGTLFLKRGFGTCGEMRLLRI